MPGNSASRLAAMTCSSRTYVRVPDLQQARQHRRHLDAREAPLARLGVADRHRQRQRQVADVRERVARVDGQRRQHREDLVEEALPQLDVALRALLVADDADALLGELARGSRRTSREWLRWSWQQPRRGCASRISGADSPSGVGIERPAATCCFRPATRTWKNSSRLLAKMARKRARSSSGLRSSLRLEQHALVELEPRQLAVDVRQCRAPRATGCAAADWSQGGHDELRMAAQTSSRCGAARRATTT